MPTDSGGAIGIVLPSNNVVLPSELTAVLPAGYCLDLRRIAVAGGTTEDVQKMASRAAADVEDLVVPGVDRYVYGCVASTLASPPGWEAAFAERLTELSHRPCMTAMSVTMLALAAVGARRVTLLTPYPPAIHALAVAYFQDRGLAVVSSSTLDIRDLDMVGRLMPEEVEAAALGAIADDADALCILATDLPTFRSIARLEDATGKAVVTTNQSIAWALLGEAARSPQTAVLGRLFGIPYYHDASLLLEIAPSAEGASGRRDGQRRTTDAPHRAVQVERRNVGRAD